MLEVEVKYRVPDPAALRARVEAVARLARTETNEDHYFNAPDRDFAVTGEAVRLRRVGDDNYLTYKGPKRPGPTKTRTEIEIPLGPGPGVANDAEDLFAGLGYRPTAMVRKLRAVFELTRSGFEVSVCLDEVDGVGHFAEVEVVAGQADMRMAQVTVLAVADELGLTEVEPRSYLGMVLAARSGSTP